MGNLLRVEFHCHTRYSKDSLSEVDALLDTCRQRGIDRLVVTDHNTIEGALEAKTLDPQRVIIGEEILTQDGELLAAYVQETIPKGLPAMEAITRLRSQGAFISVSHPFDRTRSGHWKETALLEILPHVDAIETFNARCFPPAFNRRARDFAQLHGVSGTVGSDAHALFEVGKATMFVPHFNDAESLRRALPQATYETSHSAPWVRLTSRYAVLRKGLLGEGR
jgi:hypothetical protein